MTKTTKIKKFKPKAFKDIHKHFRLRSQEEADAFERKFRTVPPTWSQSDFIRFATTDCEPPRTRRPRPVKDHEELAKILYFVQKLGTNVNTLARRANMGSWPESDRLDDACFHIREIRDALLRSLGYQSSSNNNDEPPL